MGNLYPNRSTTNVDTQNVWQISIFVIWQTSASCEVGLGKTWLELLSFDWMSHSASKLLKWKRACIFWINASYNKECPFFRANLSPKSAKLTRKPKSWRLWWDTSWKGRKSSEWKTAWLSCRFRAQISNKEPLGAGDRASANPLLFWHFAAGRAEFGISLQQSSCHYCECSDASLAFPTFWLVLEHLKHLDWPIPRRTTGLKLTEQQERSILWEKHR